MNKLFEILKNNSSCEPFEPGKDNIWTSEKFSDFVLSSYLNPNIPGGGKDSDQIEEYVTLINSYTSKGKNLLDIGCGAGLYCEKLYNTGLNVTGIDISEKAISHAKKQATSKNLNINYICDDVFTVSFEEKFDIIIILYKTFATFSKAERDKLLLRLYNLLAEDGILILDVPPVNEFTEYNEINLWAPLDKGNIIIDDACLNLISNKKYPENILLNTTIYITSENEVFHFNDWLKFFTKDEIKNELLENHFNVKKILNTKDNSLAIVCTKN